MITGGAVCSYAVEQGSEEQALKRPKRKERTEGVRGHSPNVCGQKPGQRTDPKVSAVPKTTVPH